MWRKASIEDTAVLVWKPNERTATVAEKRVALTADSITGDVHLVLAGKHGQTLTITLPPAAARNIGTALIEAGVIAGTAK